MSQSVVGLFKNMGEAQSVKQQLVNQGFSAGDIRVMANDEVAKGTSPTEGGFGNTISNFFRSLTGGGEEAQRHYGTGLQQGGTLLAVTVPDGKEKLAADLLERYGAQEITDQSTSPVSAGVGASRGVSEGAAIPVVEENLQVGKRQVQRGGVRVYSHLVEQPVEESVKLREEHVHVDRQRVDRPATEADFAAFKEGTIELTETAEEAVVSKQARVVEEIIVGKEASERTEVIRDKVRRTEVEVEQLGTDGGRATRSFGDYDTDFRNHFKTNYTAGGKSYDSYAPAYQCGYTLANDPRYASGNWSAVEAAAQKDWTAKGTGKWDDFKGAVQEGWNRVRGAGMSRASNA